jgi:hypothetical protein
MRILCRWTSEALFRSWSAGMSTFFWYSLEDEPNPPGARYSETVQSGLFFRGATAAQNQPKRVYYAFRFPFVAYPTAKGLSVWGRTPASSPGRVTIQVQQGGHWRRAGALSADSQGIFQGVLKSGYGQDKQGAVRADYAGTATVPFSMHPVKDFRQPPFG